MMTKVSLGIISSCMFLLLQHHQYVDLCELEL